ncbi:hypothetical protein PPGU19_092100 (plasmid) [Paraburkholderia sp. PGU19]|nr:hypothetical protein PPGU19_092100 [Paraburkholderia sp. PGU19]
MRVVSQFAATIPYLKFNTVIPNPVDIVGFRVRDARIRQRLRQRHGDGAKLVVKQFVRFFQRATKNPIPRDDAHHPQSNKQPGE